LDASIVDVLKVGTSLLCDVSDTLLSSIVFGVVITYAWELSVVIFAEEASFSDGVSIAISGFLTSDEF